MTLGLPIVVLRHVVGLNHPAADAGALAEKEFNVRMGAPREEAAAFQVPVREHVIIPSAGAF